VTVDLYSLYDKPTKPVCSAMNRGMILGSVTGALIGMIALSVKWTEMSQVSAASDIVILLLGAIVLTLSLGRSQEQTHQ
jgi:hypothetical protein